MGEEGCWYIILGQISTFIITLSILQDTSKSRDLPVLREFRDVITTTTMTSQALRGSPVTSHSGVQSQSVLTTCEVTCTDMLMTSSGLLVATGCTNGDVIVWDVAESQPYTV